VAAPSELAIVERSVRWCPASRRRAALSFAASAVLHVGAAWALEHAGVWRSLELGPVEAGRASVDSIQLVASQGPVAEGQEDATEPPFDPAISELTAMASPEAVPAAAAESSVPPLPRSVLNIDPTRFAEAGVVQAEPPASPLPAEAVAEFVPPQRTTDESSPATPIAGPRPGAPKAARQAADSRVDGSAEVDSVASRASEGSDPDTPPRVAVNPAPVYPPELLAARVEGRVVLRVRVGADGRVLAASIHRSSGHDAFDQAALGAVRRWRFNPARRAGLAIETEVAVPVRFVVEDGG
jgi:protein TonB